MDTAGSSRMNGSNGFYANSSFSSGNFRFKAAKPLLQSSQDYLKGELGMRSGALHNFGSIVSCVQGREMCAPGFVYRKKRNSPLDSLHLSHLACGGFSTPQKAYFANSFIPNRRKVIAKLRTKTFCCQYTQNGDALFTASQDEKIRIFKRKGYRRKYEISAEILAPVVGWSILDLVISPDSKHCVYSTWSDKCMFQCNLESPAENDERWSMLCINEDFDTERFAFFSIKISHDGAQLVGGASDGNIYTYDRERGEFYSKIAAHEDDVNSVCIGFDDHVFFSGSDDGISFAGHRDGITFIDVNDDGRYILTNSKDQTIKLWDIRRFSSEAAQERTKKSVSRQFWDYRYEPVPRKLTYCEPLEDDGSVCTFKGSHLVLHTLIHARFSPAYTGQRYIYTGCARGSCVLYDILTGTTKAQLQGHQAVVRECVWHPFENEIVTAAWDGVTALWRYDQRVRRNTNPESDGGDLESEDTTDEFYRKIDPQLQRKKKRRRLCT
uniref:WD_REPEATS_REGION domain-containing protein n=1 Tax=Syphacia muris TaxID=451379 RepID=A0A0N5AGR9_9BILA